MGLIMAIVSYGQVRVNTFTTGDQLDPKITPLADGGYLLVWTSAGQYNQDDIFAQRYDASGNRIGGEFRVNSTTTTDDQADPSVTLLNGGSYVISWDDKSTGGALFQRFSSSGAKLGGETRINPSFTEAESPTISALSDGGFVAVWERSSFSTGYDLYTQRFNASGLKVGVEARVNTSTSGAQVSAETVGLKGGGYVVVWESPNQDGSGLGIYSQRFSAAGSKVGGETRINTTTAGHQSDAALAALKSGGYVVVWESGDGSFTGVFMQRYDANGNRLGVQTRVNTTISNDQEDPSVAALTGGGYVVSWTSELQDGNGYGVYAQRYDANGNKLGSEVRINSTTAGDQENSVVVALADGGYLVSWSHSVNGGQEDIYSQRYDANGNKLSGINGDAAANNLSWSGSNSVIINGYDGNDILKGNTANDHLNGGGGNDTLNGASGSDRMSGGLGNDTYYVDNSSDVVTENASAGTDTVYSYLGNYTLAANVENGRILNTGSANLTGNSLNNVLFAGPGNNVLNGSVGFDTASYAYSSSAVTASLAVTTAQATGGSGSDTLIAFEGLHGSNYNDRLTGNSAANSLYGGAAGNDILLGGAGNDTLNGGTGNDRLTGGIGRDGLIGGSGNDVFDFNGLNEMGLTSTTWDVISDFVRSSDKIDLSTLDANTATTINDAFTQVIGGASAFSSAGQLKVVNGVLYGNTDADTVAEFAIQLTGVGSLSTADFVL